MKSILCLIAGSLIGISSLLAQEKARVEFSREDDKGLLRILIDGKEAMVYRYGDGVDLPHYFPINSPSGKVINAQQIDPYPHHRAFWFADTVEFGGRKISFYNALYTGVAPTKADPAAPAAPAAPKAHPRPPFRDHIRQVELIPGKIDGPTGVISKKLLWEADAGKTPVLDELREIRVVALGDGEYFLDMKFTLTAAYGDVKFVSDAVHYAWPFIRVGQAFTPTNGGTLLNSEGGSGQKETNMKPARWVDYSNTIEGAAEGIAIFSHPSNDHPHAWLTRDYGTFGPRRIDAKSGKPFTLEKGKTITTRAGVLVHKGNAKEGKVAQRYQAWGDGKL